MKHAWHFNTVNPRFKNREATQGEFFTSDTELRGFIREAIQNSLDAKRSRVRGPIKVRLFVSGEAAALSPERADRYFNGGWPHFRSETSGLRDAPRESEPCRFIVCEDQGTTALTGDVGQYHEVPGVKNPFYYFFRAEGQSNKTDGGRGRWGLGKFVFPRSSRIRSFFGVTVRHDDGKRLLVGQSILRSHHAGGKSYTPDGWFGLKPDRNAASLPVSDQRFINRFLNDFRLQRAYEPGLSLVVPFCDESWTANAVTEAIVQDYFYPLLRGDLVVSVEDAESKTVLNASTLESVAAKSSASLRRALCPLIDLTKWSLGKQKAGEIVTWSSHSELRDSTAGEQQSLSDSSITTLRKLFQSEGRVAVRVPVEVHPIAGSSRPTFLDAFIEKSEGSQQKKPLFVRDGIVISDVRTRPIRDVNALVSISDGPLTAFLGDAENPAHTEWSEESSHIKGKYLRAATTLKTVRNAVADLCHALTESADEEDPVLLLDVFSLGAVKGQHGHQVSFPAMSSGNAATGSGLLRLQALQRRSRPRKLWHVTSRKGGFRVANRGGGFNLCPALSIHVAYDCRGGCPLRKYAITDFQLDSSAITLKVKNALILIPEANRLIVLPQRPDFEVIVTGFDVNRDLFLKAFPNEPENQQLRYAA